MEYDLSGDSLINAGGAFLFFLIGIAILLVARGSRRGRLIGAFATSWGIAQVLGNLLDYRSVTAGPEPWIVSFFMMLVTVFAVLLARDLARGVSREWRRFIAIIASTVAACWLILVVLIVPFAQRGIEGEFGAGFDALVALAAVSAFTAAFVVLLAASIARFHAYPNRAGTERRATAHLVLSFGLFTMLLTFVNGSLPFQFDRWDTTAIHATLVATAIAALVAAVALVAPKPGPEPRVARSAFLALLGAAALGAAINDGNDYGAYGIVRTIGVALLALAILKHDLLGVPLPHFAVRRGLLTGGALATLFIVAQVAQNFLSAKYGLLTGGILAGVFVFAASPVQRAIERRSGLAGSAAAAAYKAVLRNTMRDARMTPKEERKLAETASALGISPVQALDLRDEVLREANR